MRKLLLCCLLLGFISCENNEQNIYGSWKLTSLDTEEKIKLEPLEKIILTLKQMKNEEKDSYHLDCFINKYNGSFIKKNNKLEIGLGFGTRAISTRMENAFFKFFKDEVEVKINEKGNLIISKEGKKAIFSPVEISEKKNQI